MKILNNIYKFFFIFFFIFFTNITTASENQLFDYYKTIKCLVCDGQSIQESDTEFALNLKDVMDYNQRQINVLDYMVETLKEEGALTVEGMYIRINIHDTTSFSEPSDPDYKLMKQQAAQKIQKSIRNRQKKQSRGYIQWNIGLEAPNPTREESFRRFTVAERMTDVNDPQKGYLHDVFFPPKKSNKKKYSKKKR